jgi:hypothetical protein
MKWDWSTFWMTVVALTATVVVIVPIIDKGKEVVAGGYSFGEDEDGLPL